MEWQPIETAPKDGTKFIALKGSQARTTYHGQHYVKYPHEDGGPTYRDVWNYEALGAIISWNPTIWMPLPEPPK